MAKGKVVAAGHSCLDITPIFPEKKKPYIPENFLAPGKLVQMRGVDIHAGGAVSNTGIAMKMLGADVKLLTKTGTDEFGRLLTDIYEEHGVADGVISGEGERTSYSVVLAMPDVDRIFLHDPGCNNTFSFTDVEKADLSGVSLFHFGYPPLMEKMYADEGREFVQMMQYVKSLGIATSLDMAAIDASSDAAGADWNKILEKVLPYVDFFVPSVEELCFMLDRDGYERWQQRAKWGEMVSVLRLEDIEPLAGRCMQMGVKALLLKCGAPGLYYRTAEEDALKELARITGLDARDWAGRAGFENSYVPEKVVSATGAGDTTIAAFLTAMLAGYPFEMCIHLAAAQGASCVADYGALGGICGLDALEEKIKAGWAKGTGLQE